MTEFIGGNPFEETGSFGMSEGATADVMREQMREVVNWAAEAYGFMRTLQIAEEAGITVSHIAEGATIFVDGVPPILGLIGQVKLNQTVNEFLKDHPENPDATS